MTHDRKALVIDLVTQVVKAKLTGEETGHDWNHIMRVVRIGKRIAQEEGADLFIVELALLLHDIADHKFNDGDHQIGPRIAGEILRKAGADEPTIATVRDIISKISFLGNKTLSTADSLEAKVCQDADRLDAMGSIGIARAFATGAIMKEVFHDPNIPVPEHVDAESYTKAKGKAGRTVINHFHEKLLHLKDLMNTRMGKEMALHRHHVMVVFLGEFDDEWNGKH